MDTPREMSELQLDFIKELFNLGVNEATNLLSSMINVEIGLSVPEVKLVSPKDLLKEMAILGSDDLSAINMEFKNDFSGLSQLVFTNDNANKLVKIFSDEVVDIGEFDEMKSGALIEIGNILLNAVMGVFSNTFKHDFTFFIPVFFENYQMDFFNSMSEHMDNVVLLGQTLFVINKYEITGNTVLFLNIASFKHFLSMIDRHLQTLDI